MKEFLKKHRLEIISTAIFIIAIVFACIYNFGTPKTDDVKESAEREELVTQMETEPEAEIEAEAQTEEKEEPLNKPKAEASAENKAEETKQDEPAQATPTEEAEDDGLTQNCSLRVDCSTILNNMDKLKQGKEKLITNGGVMLSLDTANFRDGETAFELLLRELKKNDIGITYKETQFSSGCYIENIGGIGEFDCGQTSGWLYKVNGEMPNVDAANYKLKNGDKVEFLFTCKMGDV